MLKTLKIYADKNGLTLNIDKTKVMIFNKNGRHIGNLSHVEIIRSQLQGSINI